MSALIIFVCLLFSRPISAQTDLAFGLGGRSYPSVGAQAEATVGHNFTLWGEAKNGNMWFGSVRPYLKAFTSTVTHEYEGALEVFPVSFLGFVAGTRQTISQYDQYKYFDCESDVVCKYVITKPFTQGKLALKFGPVVAQYKYSYHIDHYTKKSADIGPIGDYTLITLAPFKRDAHSFSEGTLGLVTSLGFLGLRFEYADYQNADAFYSSQFFVWGTRQNNTSYFLGLGSLETSHIKKGLVLFFNLGHDLWPKATLF